MSISDLFENKQRFTKKPRLLIKVVIVAHSAGWEGIIPESKLIKEYIVDINDPEQHYTLSAQTVFASEAGQYVLIGPYGSRQYPA